MSRNRSRNLAFLDGPHLRHLLFINKISQHEFCRRCGLDDGELSKAIRGSRAISSRVLALVESELLAIEQGPTQSRTTGTAKTTAKVAR
jgi:transcriptional regulator with XRE-family HTH domain